MLNPLILVFCETLFYGIYTVVFFGSMYMLIFMRSRTTANVVMIAVCVTMYLCSSGHMATTLMQQLLAEKGKNDGSPNLPVNYIQYALEGANYIIGDVVVIWRLWAIWNRELAVCVVPMVLVVGATVTVVGGVHAMAVQPPFVNLFETVIAKWGLVFVTLTLANNVLATVLIGWRARSYYRRLNRDLKLHSNSAWILVMLVESGAAYCATWIISLALWLSGSINFLTVLACISQLIGIYPTGIILLVSLNQTIVSARYRSNRSSHPVDTPYSPRAAQRSTEEGYVPSKGLIISIDTDSRHYDADDCRSPQTATAFVGSRSPPPISVPEFVTISDDNLTNSSHSRPL